MEIHSLDDLNKLESYLAKAFSKLKLGDVLHSLYLLRSNLEPFMVAGASLFATRFCSPSKTLQSIKKPNIRSLIDLSNQYYLSDPITFDQDLRDDLANSNLVFTLLRLASSQFPFNPRNFSEFSRSFLLFYNIPKEMQGLPDIPQFDFESKFQAINGFSVLDFITTGFVIYAASHNNFIINLDYFSKVRKQEINLPDNRTIGDILDQVAADKYTLIQLYEKRKNQDRRFRMYDFNPFLSYPIIKPCQDKQFSTSDKEFIHAPIPELVCSRTSTGIFYQMFNEYGTEFSAYFGHVFERYIGLVLQNSITSEELLSELDIRKFYPIKKGKSPDWILIDGSTAILFECKITRFSRAAQAIANEDAIEKSLGQVKKGLKQLANFILNCQSNIQELQRFHSCKVFKPIFISLEPLDLINSNPFREYIDNLLVTEGITDLNWQILSVDELELLQPHVAAGFRLSDILDDLLHKQFNDVLQNLNSQTNKTFADSFLYPKQEEMYQRLNIFDKISTRIKKGRKN